MLVAVKNFIKNNLITEKHTFFWELWKKRQERRITFEQETRSRMTYAQIEAEISRDYMKMFGRPLNWENPQTYNEKIHVSKVYMSSPLKTKLADKYAVREWVAEKIGSEYLIPLLRVYDSFDEIDFDALPNQFVIKCTHDSGSVTLVKDKSRINRAELRRKYAVHMKRNFAWMGFEMHYRDITPRIVVEKYMGDEINDYKFQCFGGKPYYCQVDMDRFTNHTRNFYDMNWERQPFSLLYPNNAQDTQCPEKFDDMKRVAEILCESFPHVRVDLYFIGGKIYFGEMTFTHGNGFEKFTPDEWNSKLGALWPFNNNIRANILANSSRP